MSLLVKTMDGERKRAGETHFVIPLRACPFGWGKAKGSLPQKSYLYASVNANMRECPFGWGVAERHIVLREAKYPVSHCR